MSCSGMAFFPSSFMLHQDEQRSQSPINADFTGAASFLKRPMDVCHEEVNLNGEDEMSDDGSQAVEKKRRLNIDQVKTLEKNFELGNKLEPERKVQLARTLGLQPRQVAIWFQNRRARWKTKQLEKDFDVLRRQYEAVKADNEALQAQNQKLHAEIVALKSRDSTESINLNKETDQGSCSNRSENSSEIQLDIRTPGKERRLSESRPLFPPAALRQPPQVFFRADHVQLQKEEPMGNMFCPMDDQSGLWPWLEHHHFN